VYAPTNKHTTLRALLTIVAARDMELHELDVKTAFLNEELEVDFYMQQAQGYKKEGPGMLCHLKKMLYVGNLPSCAALFIQTPAQHLPIASI
jgi:hypothetical protein